MPQNLTITTPMELSLKPGDRVDVIAPASRFSQEILQNIVGLLKEWKLEPNVPDNLFGDDLLCANNDEIRFQHLKEALLNTDSKAVICARGGYGAMRLIPMLATLSPPKHPKLFIGMSDITALNLFLNQRWSWTPIHGALLPGRFDNASLLRAKELIFGKLTHSTFQLTPLNSAAKQHRTIRSSVTGGNLTLVQSSLGTTWQIKSTDKIVFLEETNERGYKIDRMLQQLLQAGIFEKTNAIILGDFIKGEEPNGTSLVQKVLERFANSLPIPVLQCAGIGHGATNYPIILGNEAILE